MAVLAVLLAGAAAVPVLQPEDLPSSTHSVKTAQYGILQQQACQATPASNSIMGMGMDSSVSSMSAYSELLAQCYVRRRAFDSNSRHASCVIESLTAFSH